LSDYVRILVLDSIFLRLSDFLDAQLNEIDGLATGRRERPNVIRAKAGE
jgi:hypothetical protein